MLELRQVATELIRRGWFLDPSDVAADTEVIEAINDRDREFVDRAAAVTGWLGTKYRAFMGFTAQSRSDVARQIIKFADNRLVTSLEHDRDEIIAKFNDLEKAVAEAAPRTNAGKQRDVTSLTSKALWCCYPEDIPIFDRNAARALSVLSRLYHWAPRPNQGGYPAFVDVWLRAYEDIEPAIDEAGLSNCARKVRILDGVLWYLGQGGYYAEATTTGSLAVTTVQ